MNDRNERRHAMRDAHSGANSVSLLMLALVALLCLISGSLINGSNGIVILVFGPLLCIFFGGLIVLPDLISWHTTHSKSDQSSFSEHYGDDGRIDIVGDPVDIDESPIADDATRHDSPVSYKQFTQGQGVPRE